MQEINEVARYLTPKQAAHYLGTTPQALAILRVRGGSPPFTRLGARSIRYDIRDLEAYMAARRKTSTSQTEVKQ